MSSNKFDGGVFCFVPDPTEVFVIARLSSAGNDFDCSSVDELRKVCIGASGAQLQAGGKLIAVEVVPELLPSGIRTHPVMRQSVAASSIVPIDSIGELQHPPSDLIKLMFVQRPTILHTLRQRFMSDEIYTAIGPILVAINPFKWVAGIYSSECKQSYLNGSANLSDQPHVFAVAHEAFSDLQFMRRSQSLIISGESGAGKTEATKQCLNYLAFSAGSSSGIQEKILKASPILEAWGNAKTLRNNNSSRFGKFIEIWFDASCKSITGSSNTTYILEKSRVVFQEAGERNYHVFYQLLRGASAEELRSLGIHEFSADPSMVQCINQSGCIEIEDVDDGADYRETNAAFEEIGFSSAEERGALYQVISGILLLGNVLFEANPVNSEESRIKSDDGSEEWLSRCAQQFQVDTELLRKALLFKRIQSGGGKRASIAFASYLPPAAAESRNALTKEIYSRCFDWIVEKINTLVRAGSDSSGSDSRSGEKLMIGILDIFGFEIFQKNSFEQLCINLANEALQQHFNYNIFQAEMDVYVAEDVPVPPLDYKDNQDVLDLIMKPPKGLIPMLDEEGRVPRGSWEGFYNKFVKANSDNCRFNQRAVSSKSSRASTRDASAAAAASGGAKDMGIVHYAGVVFYDPSLFLVKNKDTLSQDLIEVLSLSQLPLLQSLFDPSQPQVGDAALLVDASAKSKRSSATVDTKMTVGKKFSLQLDELIRNLNSTKPRYIRCIKPNQIKKPNVFVPDLTNEQLTYSGVFEAVIIMQNGYPFRLSHLEYRSAYHMLVRDPLDHALLFDRDGFLAYISNNNTHPAGTSTGTKSTAVGAVKTKSSRPFSRDQCQLMVRLIAQSSTHSEELQRCFVGKTKTFFKVQQHQLLTKVRSEVIGATVVKIQCRARVYVARKLYRLILSEQTKWTAAIGVRDIPIVQSTSAAIERLVERLNRAVVCLNYSMAIVHIGQQFAAAVELESSCVSRIAAIIDQDSPVAAKFDQLERILNEARSIKFVAHHKDVHLQLKWSDNSQLVDFAKRIDDMGRIVRVQRTLQEAAASSAVNEPALEQALADLTLLRSANLVDDNFCSEEAKIAVTTIEEARNYFDDFLKTVSLALQKGSMKLHSKPDSLDFDVEVDAAEISAVIDEYSSSSQRGGRSRSQQSSKRVQKLTELCRELRHLRQLAAASDWAQLWSIIQTERWRKIVQPEAIPHPHASGGDEDTAAATADFDSDLFVPTLIAADVARELNNMSVCALTYFVVPRVEEAAAVQCVPSVPVLQHAVTSEATESVPIVRTLALSQQLAAASEYRAFFDDRLITFFNEMSELLELRIAVNRGSYEPLRSVVDNIRFLQKSSSDVKHSMNFIAMYELIAQVSEAVAVENIREEIGYIDLAKVQLNMLREAHTAMLGFNAIGDAWVDLLQVCEALLSVKDSCVRSQEGDRSLDVPWKTLQKAELLPVWRRALLEDGLFSAHIKECVSQAHRDIQLLHQQVQHERSLLQLADVLQNSRGISADLNDRNSASAVDVAVLQNALRDSWSTIIATPAALSLKFACEAVISLRQAFVAGDWQKLALALLSTLPEELRESDLKSSRALAVKQRYTSSQIFVTQHANSRSELLAAYRRYFDMYSEQQLVAALATRPGYISASDCDVENDSLERNSLGIAELESAIRFVSVGDFDDSLQTHPDLSDRTFSALCTAKLLYCLRSTLCAGRWEPDEIIPFGSNTSADLPSAIRSVRFSSPYATEEFINIMQNLEATILVKRRSIIFEAVFSAYPTELSVADVLAVFDECGADHSSVAFPIDFALISEEVDVVRRLSMQRRLKSALLIAGCSGCTKGSIDSLDESEVRVEELNSAIQFVEAHLNDEISAGAIESPAHQLLCNWLVAGKRLLIVREAVLQSKNAAVDFTAIPASPLAAKDVKASALGDEATASDSTSGTSDLGDLLEPQFIEEILESIYPGFPLDELQLVLIRLKDRICFLELTRAMEFGRPAFNGGKFDISRVQHWHILERLNASRKMLRKRSDRLDRLFFYVEMCINLRTAILADQWELSARGEKAVTDRSIVTVKRCMHEYEQAGKFFRTPAPGVPPHSLNEEFRSVSREWERRLMKQTMTAAFKRGAVAGVPFRMKLSGVHTGLLEAGVKRALLVEQESGEVDNDVQIFTQAAQELIEVRKAAVAVQHRLAPPAAADLFAGRSSNAMEEILNAPFFLPECIDRAISKVQALRSFPYPAISDWEPVGAVVKQLSACYSIPTTIAEVELLAAETYVREFVSRTLQCLVATENINFDNGDVVAAAAATTGFSKSAIDIATDADTSGFVGVSGGGFDDVGPRALSISALVDTLTQTALDCREHLDVLLQRGAVASSSRAAIERRTDVVELLHRSVIILVHLLRARTRNAFDEYSRDWEEDRNFDHTPRFTTLEQDLTGVYSVQKVYRCARKLPRLHSAASGVLTLAAQIVHDAVSEKEMSFALEHPSMLVKGTVGILQFPSVGFPDQIESISARLREVGIHSEKIRPLFDAYNVIAALRSSLFRSDYNSAWSALLKYLRVRNSDVSLQRVLEVLANLNTNVAVANLAPDEFLLLAQHTCDRIWQRRLEESLLPGRVRGVRGRLQGHLIDCTDINNALNLQEYFTVQKSGRRFELSVRAEYIIDICRLVQQLRQELLSITINSEKLSAETSSQETNFADLHRGFDLVVKESVSVGGSDADFRKLAGQVIGTFSTRVLETAVGKIERISLVNAGLVHSEDPTAKAAGVASKRMLLNIVERLQDLLKSQSAAAKSSEHHMVESNEEYNEIGVFDGGDDSRGEIGGLADPLISEHSTESLMQECSLISAHVYSALAQSNLLQAMKAVMRVVFDKKGLRIAADSQSVELNRAIAESSNMRWQRALSCEYWCAESLELARAYAALLDFNRMHNRSDESTIASGASAQSKDALLHPGTAHFAHSLPLITALSARVITCVKTMRERRGASRQRCFPWATLSTMSAAFRAAIYEHSILCALDSFVRAEQLLKAYDGTGHMVIEVQRLRPLVCEFLGGDKAHLILSLFGKSYNEYSTALLDNIAVAEKLLVTVAGKQLASLVAVIIKFHAFVAGEQRVSAKQLHSEIKWIDIFPSRNCDLEIFHNYMRYLELRRRLELGILNCSTPLVTGWSLQSGGKAALYSIGLEPLGTALREAREWHMDLLDSDLALQQIVKLGDKLLELQDALRAGLWVSAADADRAISANANDAPARSTGSSRRRNSALGYTTSATSSVIAIHEVTVGAGLLFSGDKNGFTCPTEGIFDAAVSDRVSVTAFRSVYAVKTELELLLVNKCADIANTAVHSFLFEYLNRLNDELVAVQLEHIARAVFSSTRVSGRAGELVLPDGAVQKWTSLVTLFGNHSSVIAKCPSLCSATQTAHILNRLIMLQKKGNVLELMKYVNLLAYLDGLVQEPGSLTASTFPPRRAEQFRNIDEILDISDAAYQRLFATNFSIASSQLAPATEAGTSNAAATAMASNDDGIGEGDGDGGIDAVASESVATSDKSTLQKIFKIATGNTLSSACKLRSEVSDCIELLQKHAMFEYWYSIYAKCVEETPAAGIAGDIDAAHVDFESLRALTERMRAEGFADAVAQKQKQKTAPATTPQHAHQQWIWGAGYLLFLSAQSLLDIRVGQKKQDEQLIRSGVEKARSALAIEREYSMLSENLVLLGQAKKAFISAAEVEVQLAADDLQQRGIIESMQSALALNGLPLNGFPFDFKHVEVDDLERAFASCEDVPPVCERALQLYWATKVILALRTFVKNATWMEMIDYLRELNIEKPNVCFSEPTATEFSAAEEIAVVSNVVQLAQIAYSSGYLTGCPGRVSVTSVSVESATAAATADAVDKDRADYTTPSLDLSWDDLNIDGLLEVLKAFESVKPEWINEQLQRHKNTAEVLHSMRLNIYQSDWRAVHALTSDALNPYNLEFSKPLVPACVAEIALAQEHAAFMVSSFSLKQAVGGGCGLRGSIGAVQTAAVQLQPLVDAVQVAGEMECGLADIARFVRAAELLFHVRRAILLGNWIKIDHTFTYAYLLGANFQPSFEAVDRIKILQISLPRHATARGSNSSDDAASSNAIEDGEVSVEDILCNWEVLRSRNDGDLPDEVLLELQLASDEAKYRRIVSELVKAIHSPGATGIPGNLVPSTIATRTLEKAIHFASAQLQQIFASSPATPASDRRDSVDASAVSSVSFTEAHGLLRDAKLLLQARRSRLAQQWSRLIDILHKAELIQQRSASHGEGNGKLAAATTTVEVQSSGEDNKSDAEVSSCAETATEHRGSHPIIQAEGAVSTDNDVVQVAPITAPVWEELRLLQSDCIFHLCLSSFATEMMRKIEEHHCAGTQIASLPSPPPRGSKYDTVYTYQSTLLLRASKLCEVVAAQEDRVASVRIVLDVSLAAYEEFPSAEFERLLEAQETALELREFRKRNPSNSPQEIINHVAKIKKRDATDKVPSFMSLLIYEISQMSNVLDFPLNLQIIQREIVNGQRYINSPVGSFDVSGVGSSLEVLAAAYQAAKPSLEIMGTEDNRALMRLADAVIEMRRALLAGAPQHRGQDTGGDSLFLAASFAVGGVSGDDGYDLTSVIRAIEQRAEDLFLTENGEAFRLQPPFNFVQDEIKRLRLEAQNRDSCILLDNGLKNGRYIDVLSIAKMVNQHDRTVAAQAASVAAREARDKAASIQAQLRQQELRMQQNQRQPHPPSTAAKRAARRMSVTVAALLSRVENDDNDGSDNDDGINGATTATIDFRATQLHTPLPAHRLQSAVSFSGDATEKEKDSSSLSRFSKGGRKRRETARTYIHNVLSSIDALNEAVETAGEVEVKSPATIYYLDAAKVVLELRQNIVEGEWNEVRRITLQHGTAPHDTQSELPATALEEINAVKEGLAYQDCMARICKAFMSGATDGSPHDLDLPSCDDLEAAVAISAQLRFVDQSATIMVDLARKLLDVRRCLQFDRWLNAERADEPDDFPTLAAPEAAASGDRPHWHCNRQLSVVAIATSGDYSCMEDTLAVTRRYSMQTLGTGKRSELRQRHIQQQVNVLEYFVDFADQLDQSSAAFESTHRTSFQGPGSPVDSNHGRAKHLTVELAVAAFLRFQHDTLPRLQSLLGIHIQGSAERTLFPAVDDEDVAATVELAANIAETDSYHEWIKHQWQSVCRVQTEVRLVQQVIHYRKVLLSLQSAMELTPDPVRIFMGDLEISAAVYWSQYHGDRHYDDAVLSGVVDVPSTLEQQRRRRSQSSIGAFSQQRSAHLSLLHEPSSASASGANTVASATAEESSAYDIFCVEAMKIAIKFAKSYLVSVEYDTSEELLLLLHSSALLLDFRTVLAQQSSRDKLLKLNASAHQQREEHQLSATFGNYELNAYTAAATESDLIYSALISGLVNNQVHGPLDKLSLAAVEYRAMEQWIDRARAFLSRGGAKLTIGLQPVLEQAKVMCKLRCMLLKNDWESLSRVLRLHSAHSERWTHAAAEFRHIYQAYRFRCFQQELYKALSEFRSSEDLEHGLAGLQIDYHCLNHAFTEFLSILDYRSDLLQSAETDIDSGGILVDQQHHRLQRLQKNGNYILSDSFFVDSNFIASKALWRLMNAVLHKRWYIKQRIHNNPQQLVAVNADNFLFSFFGLVNADYADNVYSVSQMRETVDLLAASASGSSSDSAVSQAQIQAQSHRSKESFLRDAEETVFSVLIATDWSTFPAHVQKFFNLARNRLVDIYIRSDLIYYCAKGATKLDAAGNIVLSELFLRFLHMSVEDSNRAVAISNQLLLSFKWCAETEKWLRAARLIVQCRRVLIDSNHDTSFALDGEDARGLRQSLYEQKHITLIRLLQGEGLLTAAAGNSSRDGYDGNSSCAVESPLRRSLCWRQVPHLSAVEDELCVLEKYCYGFLAEQVLMRAIDFLAAPRAAVQSNCATQLANSAELLAASDLILDPVQVIAPSAYHTCMIRGVSLLRSALRAAQAGQQMRLNSRLRELEEIIQQHAGEQWAQVSYSFPAAGDLLHCICSADFHADLLDDSMIPGPITLPLHSVRSDVKDPVMHQQHSQQHFQPPLPETFSSDTGNRGKVSSRFFSGTDLAVTKTAMSAEQIRQSSIRSLTQQLISLERPHAGIDWHSQPSCGSAVQRKRKFCEKIATALCTLLLLEQQFADDREQQEGRLQQVSALSTVAVPGSNHARVDLKTVRDIHRIYFELLDDNFIGVEPCWSAALLIALAHLHLAIARQITSADIVMRIWRRSDQPSISDHHVDNDEDVLACQHIVLSADLPLFLTELELEKFVLIDSMRTSSNNPTAGVRYRFRTRLTTPASLRKVRRRPGDRDAPQSSAEKNDTDWQPAILILTKQLAFFRFMQLQNRAQLLYASVEEGYHLHEQDIVIWLIEQLAMMKNAAESLGEGSATENVAKISSISKCKFLLDAISNS